MRVHEIEIKELENRKTGQETFIETLKDSERRRQSRAENVQFETKYDKERDSRASPSSF